MPFVMKVLDLSEYVRHTMRRTDERKLAKYPRAWIIWRGVGGIKIDGNYLHNCFLF